MPVITHVRGVSRERYCSGHAVSRIARCCGSMEHASATLMRKIAPSKANTSLRYTPKRTWSRPTESENLSTSQRVDGVGTTQSCQRPVLVPGSPEGTTTGFWTIPVTATMHRAMREPGSVNISLVGRAWTGAPISVAPSAPPTTSALTERIVEAMCSLNARTEGKLNIVVASTDVPKARFRAFCSSTVPRESMPCSMSGSSRPISEPEMLLHIPDIRLVIFSRVQEMGIEGARLDPGRSASGPAAGRPKWSSVCSPRSMYGTWSTLRRTLPQSTLIILMMPLLPPSPIVLVPAGLRRTTSSRASMAVRGCRNIIPVFAEAFRTASLAAIPTAHAPHWIAIALMPDDVNRETRASSAPLAAA